MKEIWKDVKDYEGLYQVSNLGNVRKLRFINNIANKEKIFMITPQLINSGYYKVMLSKNGGYKNKTLHRLVAETFIPNPENKPQVNHKDGNKLNSNVDNLEWVTNSENSAHAIDIGLNVGYKLHKSIPIQQIKDGIVIKEYPSINSVRYDGFDVSNVNKCLKGRLKTYKGYEWRHLW